MDKVWSILLLLALVCYLLGKISHSQIRTTRNSCRIRKFAARDNWGQKKESSDAARLPAKSAAACLAYCHEQWHGQVRCLQDLELGNKEFLELDLEACVILTVIPIYGLKVQNPNAGSSAHGTGSSFE